MALERIPVMRVGRILHVEPYATEPASFTRTEEALTAPVRHVEVYISDPRRSKPERLKTVLLGEIEG